MRHLSANTARNDFDGMLTEVTKFNEPVTIVSDDNRVAVIISIEEWNSIQETLFLNSIPGMVDSIKKAANEPPEQGIPASEVDFGV